MEKHVMLILIGKRRASALRVQELLTEYGCNIKTRLGVHDGVLDRCSDVGLIMLEVAGEADTISEFEEKVSAVDDVSVKLVTLTLP